MLLFLLDEHLRGPLWPAILRHNAQGGLLIDAVRVGDPPDLPLGSDDPAARAVLLVARRPERRAPRSVIGALGVRHHGSVTFWRRPEMMFAKPSLLFRMDARTSRPNSASSGLAC